MSSSSSSSSSSRSGGGNTGAGAGAGEDGTSTAAGCRLMERPTSHRTASTMMAARRSLANAAHKNNNGGNLVVFTWGRGSDGQLGLGDTANQEIPTFVDALQHVGVRHIACGSGHTVVLSNAGEIYSVGRGDDGRLGHGDNGWKYVPRLVRALSGHVISAVTCGSYHTAAISQNGDLYTWGGGMYGKLGHGNENGSAVPKKVESSMHGIPNNNNGAAPLASTMMMMQHVACGSRHTVAVTTAGVLYSWGDREQGVSGHGDVLAVVASNAAAGASSSSSAQQQQLVELGHQLVPKLVERLATKRVVQVSACGFHTGCLTNDGECYTWGEGKFGRLGHGTELNAVVPTLVQAFRQLSSSARPVQISCGGFHTAVVTDAGSLYTFGGGEHGQLGHNDRVNKLTPTKVMALAAISITQITCGWSHTAALDDVGQVYTWGNSDHGKLGHADLARKVAVPQVVETLKHYRVVKVASYNEHTAALVEPNYNYFAGDGSALSTPSGAGGNGAVSPLICNAVPVTAMYKAQLKAMINDEEFSDVTFLLDDQPVYAHKAILAQRCEHFAAMFRSGMRESTERSIPIPNVRRPVFLLLLEYFYTDTVTEIDVGVAVELYIAADCYGAGVLERLKEMCVKVVMRNLCADNAGPLLQSAFEHHCDRLKDMIMAFVIENFDAVTKTEGIRHVDHGLLLEILAKR